MESSSTESSRPGPSAGSAIRQRHASILGDISETDPRLEALNIDAIRVLGRLNTEVYLLQRVRDMVLNNTDPRKLRDGGRMYQQARQHGWTSKCLPEEASAPAQVPAEPARPLFDEIFNGSDTWLDRRMYATGSGRLSSIVTSSSDVPNV